jgi:predicted transcriptional regulator of viral defense system
MWNIIKEFSRRNRFGFTFQDVARAFPEKNRVHLLRILAEMANKGMLRKITHGTYHIIPMHADPETYVPDGHQVAKYLMLNKEYYIGYASARKIHGLTLQAEARESEARGSVTRESESREEAREYVVTKEQMKPAIRRFEGITCQFIQHDATRFFGFTDIWISQYEQAMVSDLEKTIVDIAAKPQHSGGILEVGNAIFQAKDRTDHDKLFYYFARNMNKSAKKRYLFLTDLLGLEWTTEHERMMEELGPGISLLDQTAPDQGRKMSKFGLKINVDPIRIKMELLPR